MMSRHIERPKDPTFICDCDRCMSALHACDRSPKEKPMTDTQTEDARLGIGGNNPPFEVELAERRAPIKAKVENLVTRLLQVPAVIETEEQHAIAVALKKEADDTLKLIAGEHEDEKEPLALKTRVIDAFFLSKGLKGKLEPLKNTVAQKNGAYQDRLAQQRAQEAAARAAEEQAKASERLAQAAELEAQGRHTEASVKMEGAQAQEQHAAALASQAAAPVKDLGRSYVGGHTSSLIVVAVPKVNPDEIDLEKLRPFLAIDALEAAVRAMIKARGLKHEQLLEGALTIKGLSFERKASAR